MTIVVMPRLSDPPMKGESHNAGRTVTALGFSGCYVQEPWLLKGHFCSQKRDSGWVVFGRCDWSLGLGKPSLGAPHKSQAQLPLSQACLCGELGDGRPEIPHISCWEGILCT